MPFAKSHISALAFSELEQGVRTALETYSNVHRGSGHHSMVTTHLFEQARDIILEHLGLQGKNYAVIFSTPRRAAIMQALLAPDTYHCLSSRDTGLPLGIRAMAVKRRALPHGSPFHTGGGTTRLISKGWVLWADAPDRFEAGTPPVINIIAFAKALQLMDKYGEHIFHDSPDRHDLSLEGTAEDNLEGFSGNELLDKLRLTLIGYENPVPTVDGYSPFVNLDYGASTPTFTPIWNTVRETWHNGNMNPQEMIQKARSECAVAMGAPLSEYEVVFTSNTTEAINLVAESLKLENGEGSESVLINTIMEHSSNDLPWRMVPGLKMIRLSINGDGFVDMNELERLISAHDHEDLHGKKQIKLLAISGASNVLGIYNNLEEISKAVHKVGAHLLVDAAQMVAHHKVDMKKTGIDYLTFSAHKVYAPFGTGVLIVKKGLLRFPSDEMEAIRSSGEENTGGIAALGKALNLLQRIDVDLIREREKELTARALRGLARVNGLTIYGLKDPDSPSFCRKGGVIVFSMKNAISFRVARELAEQGGIGVRYGCHCAHILVKHLLGVSPFLERFQHVLLTIFRKLSLPGIVRVSFGIGNSEADIDKMVQVLTRISERAPSQKRPELQKQMKEYAESVARRVYVSARSSISNG
jgi:selenocysteine lyase/cysteine desulfurase